MSELNDLVQRTPEFEDWDDEQKVRFFAWYLHTYENKDRFSDKDIECCYEVLHLEQPSSSGVYSIVYRMEHVHPKDALRDFRGYHLVKRIRDEYDAKFGQRSISVHVTKLLEELPTKVPDLREKTFLQETLTCYRSGAFRAAVVMCWNLAYFHLCHHILKHCLVAFNAEYAKRFPGIHKKARVPTIAKYDDLSTDLKESEVIAICKSAGIITNDQFKILESKLGRRNSAAHPSTVNIGQLQAEEFIQDLIGNIVLALQT